jgi:hypothetical protein
MSNENLGAENKIAGFFFTRANMRRNARLAEFAMRARKICNARLEKFAMRAATHPPVRAHCDAPTAKATATVLHQGNVGQVTRGVSYISFVMHDPQGETNQ